MGRIKQLISHPISAFFAAIVLTTLSTSGIVIVQVSWVLLGIAFLVATFGILTTHVGEGPRKRIKVDWRMGGIALLGALLFALGKWEDSKIPRERSSPASQEIVSDVVRALPTPKSLSEPSAITREIAVTRPDFARNDSDGKSDKAKEGPDLELSFVGDKPVLKISNIGGSVANGVKWFVGVWNTSKPGDWNCLPIPTSNADFIKSHSESGPIGLFGPFEASLTSGDVLVGSAFIDCPDCKRGHTYLVYIEWGKGGWYSKLPNVETAEVLYPPDRSPAGIRAWPQIISNMVPENERVKFGG